jgi:hypothetical protein
LAFSNGLSGAYACEKEKRHNTKINGLASVGKELFEDSILLREGREIR